MTHSNNVTSVSATTPTEVVTDSLIIPQNPSDRPAVYASGDLYTFYTTTRESGGDFNFFDFFLPEAGGPPPHRHGFEHEIWHTVGGEIQFNLGNQGNQSISVPEGTTVFGPRDRVHGYKNLGSTVSIAGITPGARTLSMTTPGALDLFFDAAALRIEDRSDPIPSFDGPTPQQFIDLAKFTARTDAGIILTDLDPDYRPPEDVLDYLLVLPEDADDETIEQARELNQIDDFNVWTTGEEIGIPKRPSFFGEFGIEYTSLVSLEESANEFSYNQFSLEPRTTDTFIQASLTSNQAEKQTESSATGFATLAVNSEGDINYSLTVSGLDFGEFAEAGIPTTPNNEGDDVIGVHIHSDEQSDGDSHLFDILDLDGQDETDLNIDLNEDGSTTISGIWNQKEKEIPQSLSDFLKNSGLPGQESNAYFKVHTKKNDGGELKGSITYDTNDFSPSIVSENHEIFYIKAGQLSLKIEDEIKIAETDTYVYIAPGQEYSIANFGEEKVDSLAISVVDREKAEQNFPSFFQLPSSIAPKKDIVIDNSEDLGLDYLSGGYGNDTLTGGSHDILYGDEGDDLLKIIHGGNNFLYGGSGADRFGIADGKLPNAIEFEYSENIASLLPEGISLPELADTQNIIVDFELGVDKIHINGLESVRSFDDLQLLPAFGDLESTSIIANYTEDGVDKEISLANISGIYFNELSADDFVFS